MPSCKVFYMQTTKPTLAGWSRKWLARGHWVAHRIWGRDGKAGLNATCAMLRLAAQSCLTLCDPVDCNSPGSSVHGILQARILEWVTMPSSKESSQLRDLTQVSHIAGRFFTAWATRDATYLNLIARKELGHASCLRDTWEQLLLLSTD